MEWACVICKERTGVGICGDECKVLLCEVCGSTCQVCSKLVCPGHLHVTPHGRKLCTACWNERNEKRRRREKRLTGFDALEDEARPEPELPDDLPVVRPILAASRYKGPSRRAWLVAYLFFLLSGAIVYVSFPDVRRLVWPFEATRPEYQSNMMTPVLDQNRLRHTGNIQDLDMFYHVPFFLVTWAVLLLYIGGFIVIAYLSTKGAIVWVAERIKGGEEL